MAELISQDQSELAQIDEVNDVKRSCESGIAYTLICDDYNIQKLRVQLLKSDKWVPREGYKNEVSPEHSTLKVSYDNRNYE